jgi:transcriptional regulator with XRE-family HTH domain
MKKGEHFHMTKLKQMRELKKISQVRLARKMNLKPPTVNALERKGIFDVRTAKRYALALDCHPVFLLEELD